MTDLPWEDNLLERKLESDLKDLQKTLVAFANSVKPDHIATILIGEKNDNTVVGVTDPDSIQKKVRKECEDIYPGITWRSKVYEKDWKYCVRVEIEYSGDTPHFAGPAWIRKGSSTERASEEMFQRLIDIRSGIVRELSKWLGKEITIHGDTSTVPPNQDSRLKPLIFIHRWPYQSIAKLVFVNNFWVTLENKEGTKLSEPLEKLTLSFDDKRQQLKVIVRY
jgi:hypothetical protein